MKPRCGGLRLPCRPGAPVRGGRPAGAEGQEAGPAGTGEGGFLDLVKKVLTHHATWAFARRVGERCDLDFVTGRGRPAGDPCGAGDRRPPPQAAKAASGSTRATSEEYDSWSLSSSTSWAEPAGPSGSVVSPGRPVASGGSTSPRPSPWCTSATSRRPSNDPAPGGAGVASEPGGLGCMRVLLSVRRRIGRADKGSAHRVPHLGPSAGGDPRRCREAATSSTSLLGTESSKSPWSVLATTTLNSGMGMTPNALPPFFTFHSARPAARTSIDRIGQSIDNGLR